MEKLQPFVYCFHFSRINVILNLPAGWLLLYKRRILAHTKNVLPAHSALSAIDAFITHSIPGRIRSPEYIPSLVHLIATVWLQIYVQLNGFSKFFMNNFSSHDSCIKNSFDFVRAVGSLLKDLICIPVVPTGVSKEPSPTCLSIGCRVMNNYNKLLFNELCAIFASLHKSILHLRNQLRK